MRPLTPPHKRPIPLTFRVAEEDYNWLVELMEREEHSSLSSIGRKVFRLGRQAIEQAQT